ncbi:DUF1080 domain-containing protein [Cellulophaga sp. E16_2]|uniref:3-keto-alpha-glucoside-1,2-lyase/3-keto-2-hydroxy-glucal hydratase domain-containing protein n=2 Tax=Cellulophaga TaxID=104264 RepID=E6XCR0_CELAD|nr:DUF1080 domain-containing protein [Cellulophaga sp. E16_2]ADV49049.1 protein of unknown function DUF1080 [Cellulophaga algicola DSM 14237]MBO0591502.1 DUF1080 domain-containing protein [Cellulophaga sp. E16_2]
MNKIILIAFLAFFISCKDEGKKTPDLNEETTENPTAKEMELANEWVVLFDGANFNQWKEYAKDGVSSQWKIEDGAMVFYPPEERNSGDAYNLVTKEEYTDFVLSLEWKIAEAGNSGIFWGVKEDSTLTEAYQTGPEIQVLDNTKHPDAKAGTTHQAGALYDMIAPSEDVTNPVGEWNTCEITINHKTNTGSVMLNGTMVVEFPVNDPEWSKMVATSKFADWEHFGKYTTGKIGLQDHGDGVSYRNIKIKQL